MRDLRSERGQAVTETMLASWIVILFVAGIYQVFLANQTVFRSLTAAHTELMRDAFTWNCAGSDAPFAPPGPWCDYQGGLSRLAAAGEPARAIYSRTSVPEISMPVVGLFAEHAASHFPGDQASVYGRLAHAISVSHTIPPFKTVAELRLWSGSALQQEPDEGCGMGPPDGTNQPKGERPACKRTKAGAGPYLPLSDAFLHMDIATGLGGAEIGAELRNLVGPWTELQRLAQTGGGLP